MWTEDWAGIYGLVAPQVFRKPCNLGDLLAEKGHGPEEMVRTAEAFFVSLGLQPLPETFRERSVFSESSDGKMSCMASAWNIDGAEDLRVRMYVDRGEEAFSTIHELLGQTYFLWTGVDGPMLLANPVDDGLRRAVGGAFTLSLNRAYLDKAGLSDECSMVGSVNTQMRTALEEVTYLAFAAAVERWRSEVFAGEVPAEKFNERWWELRLEYQGIVPPGPRPADAFDPGAGYGLLNGDPVASRFIDSILQFQVHHHLCRDLQPEGVYDTCSIHGSPEAGALFDNLRLFGRPLSWPDAVSTITGGQRIDAQAVLGYFKTLHEWLKMENRLFGYTCGW